MLLIVIISPVEIINKTPQKITIKFKILSTEQILFKKFSIVFISRIDAIIEHIDKHIFHKNNSMTTGIFIARIDIIPNTPTLLFKSERESDTALYASLNDEPMTGITLLIIIFVPLDATVSAAFAKTPFIEIKDIKKDDKTERIFNTVFFM